VHLPKTQLLIATRKIPKDDISFWTDLLNTAIGTDGKTVCLRFHDVGICVALGSSSRSLPRLDIYL